ncbi:MAG: IPT/TIG domain-containing protein [Deltaproteobacteria bacterium]|nr:IPT/TIG domain-containing protein [Deltaproteobacteria bacterium]
MSRAHRLVFAVFLGVWSPAEVWAQGGPRTIQYDSAVSDALAAITCGFCSGERYGSIFYALGNTGLQPADFPLTLDRILIPVAPTQVTFDLGAGGFLCEPRAQSGMTSATLEVYAGEVVPNPIGTLPGGAWPGETVLIGPESVMLEYSAENPVGSGSWEVRFNSLMAGVQVPAPNTYIRVVVGIGTGGTSEACQILGYQPPDISPFRDNDGRAGPRRHFIRELANSLTGAPDGWKWIEDIQDINGNTINGDWLIRLEITPQAAPPPVDAGVPEDATFADAEDPVDAAGPADAAPPFDSGPNPDLGITVDVGVVADSGVGAGLAISSISPKKGPASSSTDVTVVGTGFLPGVTLKVGPQFAAVRMLGGSTTIAATVPPGLPEGVHDVIATNPDGQSAILSEAFTVEAASSGDPVVNEGGCGCHVARGSSGGPWGLAILGALLLRRGRRRIRVGG